MKTCVLAATLAGTHSAIDDDDDLFGGRDGVPNACFIESLLLITASESQSWNPPSALLHFCYPFALENFTVLVMHIRRFRNYMASLQPPQDEVARHVLNDMIDYCPVDMTELETLLKATGEELRKLDGMFTNPSSKSGSLFTTWQWNLWMKASQRVNRQQTSPLIFEAFARKSLNILPYSIKPVSSSSHTTS